MGIYSIHTCYMRIVRRPPVRVDSFWVSGLAPAIYRTTSNARREVRCQNETPNSSAIGIVVAHQGAEVVAVFNSTRELF
jgi:hypothetical protein